MRVPSLDDGCVAFLTIRYYADGKLAVGGHIADKRFALELLEHAKDAIGRQIPDDKAIVVPNRDVDVHPSIPLTDLGDLVPAKRGDG